MSYSFRQKSGFVLLTLFSIFNALFFIGVYVQLRFGAPYYKTVLPAYQFLSLFSILLGLCIVPLVFFYLKNPRLHDKWYQSAVEEVTEVIDRVSGKQQIIWIVISSALVLFLELCIIRWMGSFACELTRYRNFSLLACFLGISIGYLTGARRPFMLPFLLPLLGLQFLQVVMNSVFYPYGPWGSNGLLVLTRGPFWYFIFIVVTNIAPGQLVGRLLSRKQGLEAYGASLLGSIIGVIMLTAMSAFWLSPWVWLYTAMIIYLFMFHRSRTFFAGAVVFSICLLVSCIVRPPAALEIYSPYQRMALQLSGTRNNFGEGYVAVHSNGLFYQGFSIVRSDKRDPGVRDAYAESLRPIWNDLKGKKVLALGSGVGSNIPALLKAGAASIVAVDIDPAIVYVGKVFNADMPYSNPRVRLIVNDARAFLRETKEVFDYIFFLNIDSHPYIAGYFGFRIDSFIYTRECFQQALSHLHPKGRIFLYAWMDEIASKKIFITLSKAVSAPISTFKFLPYYPMQGLYIVSEEPVREISSDLILPWDIGVSKEGSQRILTDDWPFLYLDYSLPTALRFLSFLIMVLIISVIGILLAMDKQAGIVKEGWGMLVVFFLFGAAFMLLETISIMKASLLMGYTWQTIGYVIISILAMSYIGNYLVLKNRIKQNVPILGGGLIISLIAYWSIDVNRFTSLIGNNDMSVFLYLFILALPIMFSSILFSIFIKAYPRIDRALGSNLLGAMFGGCLEYAAMICGYKKLILIIPLIYLVAVMLYLRCQDE